MQRKIMVVTGTRAEYGLLYWIMKEIVNDPDLSLQLVVTGMHLSPEFGMTVDLIEADGFQITERVDMLLSNDTSTAVTKSLGLGIIGFADVLARQKPDIMVLLGDRLEIFAAAQAGMVSRTPIAHIHGGEITEGAIDEAIRHAITKISHLHFVAAEPYRQRVIQLGEDPKNVYNYGAPGIENIRKTTLLSREELEANICFTFGFPTFVVTYHPVTLNGNGSERAMMELLNALDHFPDARIILTKPNSDSDGRVIIKLIEQYVEKNADRVKAFTSMGQVNYLSALNLCDVVIGNSSSGIIESPIFKKPCVNIGNRQNGRLKASSIIDCQDTTDSIIKAIQLALSQQFKVFSSNVQSLYGEGETASKIKNQLKCSDLETILYKRFNDIF